MFRGRGLLGRWGYSCPNKNPNCHKCHTGEHHATCCACNGIRCCTEPRIQYNNLDNIEPVAYSTKYKIVIVLDSSSSMAAIAANMMTSLNELIKDQQTVRDKPATFTLIKFADNVTTVRECEPLENIRPLSSEDYCPAGMTALYDGIGYALNRFRNERDVLMVIITDGQENASKKFNKQYITAKINEKRKYCNWEHVYLSNDLDTFEQGNNLGFTASDSTTNMCKNATSFGSYMSTNVNHAIKNFRTTGQQVCQYLNA